MISLSEKVLKFIEKESLLEKFQKSLIAVSGGIDSMCLLHLLYHRGFKLGVCHVNYTLRGIESDKDQELVQRFCKSHEIQCHILKLDAAAAQDLKSGNLQAKARHIRYEYFEELRLIHAYDSIVTAHHQDDRIETMIINLTRGSNLTGLTSLGPRRNHIVRPLIETSRSAIETYALAHHIDYRTDHTNDLLDYDRNFIRNKIINQLIHKMPRARAALPASVDYLSQDRLFRDHQIKVELDKYTQSDTNKTRLGPLTALQAHAFGAYLLYHALHTYGFNRTQTNNILSSTSTESKYFSSRTHEAVVKGDFLILKLLTHTVASPVIINSHGKHKLTHGSLTITEVACAHYNSESHVEYASLSLANGPLSVRTWIAGDRFKPLGMNGKSKKLSDYFNDLGLSRFEKEEVPLLVQNDAIIWIIGYRLNHDYRIQEDSQIIRLRYEPDSTC